MNIVNEIIDNIFDKFLNSRFLKDKTYHERMEILGDCIFYGGCFFAGIALIGIVGGLIFG